MYVKLLDIDQFPILYNYETLAIFKTAFPCPPNSFYIPFGQGCQRTCDDREGTKNCQPFNFVETCVCQNPRVLHNDECILPEECGCVSPGNDLMEVSPFQCNSTLLSTSEYFISTTTQSDCLLVNHSNYHLSSSVTYL